MSSNAKRWLSLWGGVAAVAGFLVLGSALSGPAAAASTSGVGSDCTRAGCHDARGHEMAGSNHAGLSCLSCHPDAADHPLPYEMPSAAGYFQMEVCGTCHPDQYGTYTYDDGSATKYGGSAAKQPKWETFSSYNTIIDGHGFVREYNEERSHANMLTDHAEVKRGKYEVCLQCKSTRVAYYWDSGRVATIQNDTVVEWAPTEETFTVPKGTKIRLSTDVNGSQTGVAHQVMAEVVWDGVLYTTYKKDGAVEDQKRTWVAVYALAVDGLPPGSPSKANAATCNHCHDPHTTDLRLVRRELQRAIARKGVNPYAAEKESFADASEQDRIDTVCGQCHVEYVCGKSGVDGINRDYFPWAKVYDLEGIYRRVFPYKDALGLSTYSQDWVHGKGVRASAWPNNAAESPIELPLIKSQHPETETYWNSRHYQMGLSCADCHMPQVTRSNGSTFTSHWFASPVKYLDPARAGAFATRFGVKTDAEGAVNSCARCHSGGAGARVAAVTALQDDVYRRATRVQTLLTKSLAAISKARATAGADQKRLAAAVKNHRKAHVRWENLVVSENSMGFHNAEVAAQLDEATVYAKNALSEAVRSLPGRKWPPRIRIPER